MASQLRTSPKDKIGRALYWASIAAAILGALNAAYLLIYKLTSNNAMCLGSGGCHDVNFSTYSEIYGVPVSLLGVLAFLVMLGIHVLEPRSKTFQENGPVLLFGLGLVGVIYSAYLTYIELYRIHAVCPFCVASAVLITILFIIAIVRLLRQTAS